jgi:hypothetical protein
MRAAKRSEVQRRSSLSSEWEIVSRSRGTASRSRIQARVADPGARLGVGLGGGHALDHLQLGVVEDAVGQGHVDEQLDERVVGGGGAVADDAAGVALKGVECVVDTTHGGTSAVVGGRVGRRSRGEGITVDGPVYRGADVADTSEPWSLVVPVSPAEARRRLDAALLPVGSLWFPTLAELRRWDRSTEALFVHWIDEARFEIGPRVTNPQAARFCPVLRGRVVAVGTGTRLEGRVIFPRFAGGLLVVWGLLLALWLALGLQRSFAADEPLGWLLWWAVLAASLALTAGLGAVLGGRALQEGLPELERVLADPDAGADDW